MNILLINSKTAAVTGSGGTFIVKFSGAPNVFGKIWDQYSNDAANQGTTIYDEQFLSNISAEKLLSDIESFGNAAESAATQTKGK
jgi:hypothetical protein